MKVFVKPGGADRQVPVPGTQPLRFVPAEGMLMERTRFVERRLRDGDLVIVEPVASPAPVLPVLKSAKE